MSAQVQVCLWGAAVLMPLFLNALTRRGPDAQGLAAMLVMIWGFERVMWVLWDPPACMVLYPVLDAVAGATAFTAWATRARFWKLILTATYVAQLCLHFDFWVAWPSESSLYRYILLNNLLFAAQLVCVASPGTLSAARSLLSHLPHRVGALHHPEA